MEISNILIFDDQNWIANIADKMPNYIRSGLEDTSRKKKSYRLPVLNLSENPDVCLYYQKPVNGIWALYKMENGKSKKSDWSNPSNLNEILNSAVAKGCLILCDYNWSAHNNRDFPNTLVKNLETIDGGNILFILYTTFDSESAQQWLRGKQNIDKFTIAQTLLEMHKDEPDLSLAMVRDYFARYGGTK